jgi:hypothetical protein
MARPTVRFRTQVDESGQAWRSFTCKVSALLAEGLEPRVLYVKLR